MGLKLEPNSLNSNSSLVSRPLAVGLIVLGVLGRLLPHPPNFAPLGAVSLYSGGRLRGWQAYALPLIVILASDPILGRLLGYPAYTLVTPFVCLSFLISVWIGSHLRKTERTAPIAGASIAGSLQFFLVTNFGLWISGISFPLTASGLVRCYLAGIPFLGRTLLSDLLYSGLLFGLHSWLARRAFPKEKVARTVSG